MPPNLLPLDFPFGELWEREVLRAAGSPTFITIKVYEGHTAYPQFGTVANAVWHWKRDRTNYLHEDDGYYTHAPDGKYVYVGTQWLRDHLSPEGLASFIAYQWSNTDKKRRQ